MGWLLGRLIRKSSQLPFSLSSLPSLSTFFAQTILYALDNLSCSRKRRLPLLLIAVAPMLLIRCHSLLLVIENANTLLPSDNLKLSNLSHENQIDR